MRVIFRLLAILAILVVVGAGLLAFGWQAEPFPEGSRSAERLRPGALPVASLETVFEDRSRPTARNGDYPGADSRRLETTVWYPSGGDGAPYPLLVYSHGFSSSREGGAYLGQYLASRGFVVAALDFPLTNMYAPGGPRVKDVLNQPGDVSFVIDSILSLAESPGGPLARRVDEGRIGAFGLSLGGLTTELVSYHPPMRDPRIGAALSIAGPTYMLSGAFFQQSPQLPFLMLAGDVDALVPWRSNAAPVPENVPGGELVTLAGASHTGFAGPARLMRWMDNPDALGCYIVQRNLGEDLQGDWLSQLGTPRQGVLSDKRPELCRMDPLPEAMNVLRQQMITRVVVGSFFERHFAPTAGEREQAARYLEQQLAAELPEASYRASATAVAR